MYYLMKTCLFILPVLLFITTPHSMTNQPSFGLNHKTWSTVDGLHTNFCSTVEIAPDGSIYVNHGDDKYMSVLDGFSVKRIPGPGYDFKIPVRVIQSSNNQLWANWIMKSSVNEHWKYYLDGVQLLQEGQWKKYKIDELQSHGEQIELLVWKDERLPQFSPTIENHVLVIDQKKIIEYDVIQTEKQIYKQVNDTNLGLFVSIQQALDGGYWITGQQGLAKLKIDRSHEPPKIEWKEYLFPEHLHVTVLGTLYEFPAGNMYGVALDSETANKVLLQFSESNWQRISLEALPDDTTPDLIWPGGDGSVWCYSIEQNQLIQIANGQLQTHEFSNFRSITMQTNGVFWLPKTWNLNRFAPNLWQIDKRFQPINGLYTNQNLYLDPENRFWVIDKAGVHRLQNGKIKQSYPWPSNLSLHLWGTSMAMLSDQKILIAGLDTVNNSMLLLNPETAEFQPIHHPNSNKWFRNIKRMNHGEIVVEACVGYQTNFSLDYYDLFDGSEFQPILKPYENREESVLEDYIIHQNSDVWLATSRYLLRYQDESYQRVGDEKFQKEEKITTLFEDAQGRLWLGGANTLFKLNNNRIEPVLQNTGTIRSISQSKNGNIWVSSDIGIHCNNEQSWVTYTEEDGLPSSSIQQVAEDNSGNIWANTSIGLYRFSSESDVDAPNTYLSAEQNLRLIPSDGEARFVFSGKDKWKYTRSERLYFSHRINQQEWSPFHNETVVSLSNLPYGSHQFEVKAMDPNWNVDSTPARWEFTVAYPWYQEPIFILFSIIMAAVILILAWLHLRNYLNLGQMVEERTSELQSANQKLLENQNQLRSLANDLILTEDRERKKLAADLHDRIGQSLAFCQVEMDAMRDTAEDHKMKSFLEKMSHEVEQTIEDTRSLSFELSPPVLYSVGLQFALQELINKLHEKYELDVNLDYQAESERFTDDLKSFLYRAVRELLFNVIKHADTHKAYVQIQQQDNCVKVVVSDQGAGMKEQAIKPSGFGLMSIQERITYLGGTFHIELSNPSGTTISFSVPYQGQRDDSNQ